MTYRLFLQAVLWSVFGLGPLGVATARFAAALPQSDSPDEEISIAVAGDVLPESPWRGSQDAAHFLDAMRNEFLRADLVFVNLEEPITSSEIQTAYKKPEDLASNRDYILRARNSGLPGLMKQAGVGLVGLANNHMLDYTEAGLQDTLNAFQAAGLPTVGAGLKSQAERPYVFEKRGQRVALLAFSDVVPIHAAATATQPGVASSKLDRDLIAAIQRARRETALVVLLIHWGGQGERLITPRQRHVGRLAAQAGCAAVVGDHPHVLQGIEYVGRVPVFYSAGNFAYASHRPASQEAILVRLIADRGNLRRVELVPIVISPMGAPRVAEEARARKVLARVDKLCRMFNTRVREGKLVASVPREPLVYDRSGTLPYRAGGAKETPK